MEIPVLISVAGTQRFAGMESETIELVTNGTYRYEPGLATISYVETEMTGLEGVVTTFTVEDGKKVTLRRTGKVNSTGALMIGVCATQMTVLLNERGGVLDLEYSIELERSVSATNLCHVEIRPAATAVIE